MFVDGHCLLLFGGEWIRLTMQGTSGCPLNLLRSLEEQVREVKESDNQSEQNQVDEEYSKRIKDGLQPDSGLRRI